MKKILALILALVLVLALVACDGNNTGDTGDTGDTSDTGDTGDTNEGGSDEGGSNEGGSDEGGSNEGGSNEGGSNEGGSDEGGSNESGSNEGGSNEGGSNEGGSNEGGSNEGGSNEGDNDDPNQGDNDDPNQGDNDDPNQGDNDDSGNSTHEHSFGEWEIKTPATCTAAAVEVSKCSCGDEQTRTVGDTVAHNMVDAADATHHWTACSYGCGTATEKIAHTATSISAVCNKNSFVIGDVVVAGDLTVTATCACGESYTVTEGVTLENATLAGIGANNVTVKLGELSASVQVNAAAFAANGAILADTYVSSDNKGTPFADRESMGTNSSNFRVYFKYDLSAILASDYFAANTDKAKIQFVFTVVDGNYTDTTAFSFGGFIPGEGVSDVDFANITWNALKNDYTALDWANATYLIDQAVASHHVTYAEKVLTLTFTYDQIKDFIAADGTAIFTFRAKESGVKIYSMEGTSAPALKAFVDEAHLHVFDQRIESDKYFVSANCGEETFYYKSCLCGEAGSDSFKDGVVNGHDFGDWTEVTPATCTADGLKERHCTKCEDGYETEPISSTGHNESTDWTTDLSYHWHTCSGCEEKLSLAAHFGGTATETEQATCEGCTVKYGGLATHTHQHKSTVTPPTCTADGYTTYTCECGNTYTGDEVPAKGHDMKTKYDADNHWTECANDCGETTAPVAHFGGTATETEKAVCEGCGQPYGNLKPPAPVTTVVSGTIVDDTYIGSGSASSNQSAKTTMGTYSSNFKVYLKYNLSAFLATATAEDKANAKVQFSFAITDGAVADNTKFTLKSFTVSDFISALDFASDAVTWNSVKSGGAHYEINWGDKGKAILESTQSEGVAEVKDGIITLTVDFSAIEQYIDANGNILIAFATNTSGLKIASKENTEYAIPEIKVSYEK